MKCSATVYSRTEALAHRDRVVGFAWSALKEANYGEHSEALLLVEYDLLTQKPEACLRLIHRWLGEPWHPHDFDNVEYDEPEFDRQLGAPGLHAMKRQVRFEARQPVLPPDLVQKFAPLAFWREKAGSSAFRIVPNAS